MITRIEILDVPRVTVNSEINPFSLLRSTQFGKPSKPKVYSLFSVHAPIGTQPPPQGIAFMSFLINPYPSTPNLQLKVANDLLITWLEESIFTRQEPSDTLTGAIVDVVEQGKFKGEGYYFSMFLNM